MAAAGPSAQPFVELTDIHKRYGHVTALRGVDLKVSLGQVVAIVGDNGAGKVHADKVLDRGGPGRFGRNKSGRSARRDRRPK